MRGRSSPGDARTVPLYAGPSAAGAGLRTPGEGIRVLSGCFRGMGSGGRGVALRGVQSRGAGGRRMGKGERKWGGNWGREGINAELQGRIERGWSVGVGGAELFEAVLGGKDGVRVLRRVPGCLPRGGEVVLRQCPRSSVPAGNGFWTAAPSLPPSASLLPPPPAHLSSPVRYQSGTERHSPSHPQPKFVTGSKVPSPSSALLFVPSLPARCGRGRSLSATGRVRQPPRPLRGPSAGSPGGRSCDLYSFFLFFLPPSSPPSPLFSSFPFPMLCFAFCIGKDPEAGALKPVHPNRPPPRNRRCRRAVHFPRCRSRGEEGGRGTAVPGGAEETGVPRGFPPSGSCFFWGGWGWVCPGPRGRKPQA